MTKYIKACLFFSGLTAVSASSAEEPSNVEIEELLILGTNTEKQKLAGSGIRIDAESIEKQAYSDLNQIISMSPGVYVREEDGYGLRPNIGIRGATSDRSQKVTLMEDGVLISPAPYAAPAAYYVTNASRLYSLEVLKGPSSIAYGPHTVGGVVNMVTRPAQWSNSAEFSLTAGTDRFQKITAMAEVVTGDTSWQFDALRYSSDGFKQLANGGDTGFVRNDFNIKAHWRPQTELKQSLILKVGYADEDSNETYLGLTDLDLDNDPNQRYSASQLDHFVSDHSQIHLSHSIEFADDLQVNSKLYVNQFNRSWNKYSGLIKSIDEHDEDYPIQGKYITNGLDTALVLRTPRESLNDYLVLSGQQDSSVKDKDIEVKDNAREYGSEGLQIDLDKQFDSGAFQHNLGIGIRYHHDYVHRNHQPRSYSMVSGNLEENDDELLPLTLNHDQSDALAIYLNDKISYADWTFNIGVRYEDIAGKRFNRLSGKKYQNNQYILAPGIGTHLQLTSKIGLLAGVYVGFSPASPGKSNADPEESINYEYGVRYETAGLSAEAIGFFSDYKNLIGRCRDSDSNCVVDEEFNGGQVEVGGIELYAQLQKSLGNTLELNSQLSFTYTETAFQNSFESKFSQWDLVKKGDELPYIPKFAGRWQMGIGNGTWSVDAAVKYQHEMREFPGVGELIPGQQTESLATLDLSFLWVASEKIDYKLMIRNATNESAIVARRPFGARPNLPRMVLGQIRYSL
jgi:Fe(3+) dicitrate transport protein